MHIEQLVTMANDIANFFRGASDPGAGARNVADHLRRYWAPPMRKQIIAHFGRRADQASATSHARAWRNSGGHRASQAQPARCHPVSCG